MNLSGKERNLSLIRDSGRSPYLAHLLVCQRSDSSFAHRLFNGTNAMCIHSFIRPMTFFLSSRPFFQVPRINTHTTSPTSEILQIYIFCLFHFQLWMCSLRLPFVLPLSLSLPIVCRLSCLRSAIHISVRFSLSFCISQRFARRSLGSVQPSWIEWAYFLFSFSFQKKIRKRRKNRSSLLLLDQLVRVHERARERERKTSQYLRLPTHQPYR